MPQKQERIVPSNNAPSTASYFNKLLISVSGVIHINIILLYIVCYSRPPELNGGAQMYYAMVINKNCWGIRFVGFFAVCIVRAQME